MSEAHTVPDAGTAPVTAPERTSTGELRVLLDNRRTPCAVGLIKAARTMAELPDGAVLEIWSKDRFAPMEIPIWARADGHAVTELGMQGAWPNRHYVFEVTKGAAAVPSVS